MRGLRTTAALRAYDACLPTTFLLPVLHLPAAFSPACLRHTGLPRHCATPAHAWLFLSPSLPILLPLPTSTFLNTIPPYRDRLPCAHTWHFAFGHFPCCSALQNRDTLGQLGWTTPVYTRIYHMPPFVLPFARVLVLLYCFAYIRTHTTMLPLPATPISPPLVPTM